LLGTVVSRGQLQELGGFYTKGLGQPSDDLQARVEGALLKLAQIASTHFRLVGEIVLRKPLFMAQAAQVGGEHVSQVHARSGATRSKYAPQNGWLCDDVLKGLAADIGLPKGQDAVADEVAAQA